MKLSQKLISMHYAGENSALSIISKRAKMSNDSDCRPFTSVSNAFEEIGLELPEMARNVLVSD